ncbi:putative bifunctional diguanylate cyclase/phosphodiesterase [Oceanidesulfovibrio indonesiensis]|nr:bifunctional diguanylate cyclase/phosphodiesterase [Oceanidesulfovibrio indonesiensis]
MAALAWVWRLRRRIHSTFGDLEQANRELRESASQLRAVFNSMSSLVAEVSDNGYVLRILPTRFKPDETFPDGVVDLHLESIFSRHIGAMLMEGIREVRAASAQDEIISREFEFRVPGGPRWLLVTFSSLTASSMLMVAREITRLKSAQKEVMSKQRFYSALIRNSRDIISVVEPGGRVIFESPSAASFSCKTGCDDTAGNFFRSIHPEDVAIVKERFSSMVRTGMGSAAFEMRRKRNDGAWVVLEAQATNLLNDDSVGGLVVNAHDISQRKAFEEELQRHVFLDPLTRLPNRALFMDRLNHALARVQRHETYRFGVLFVDMDRFKIVNESLGHGVGDKLLQSIARRVSSCLRKVDTMARLGGDDFIVLLDDMEDEMEAIRVAERIKEALGEPHVIDTMEVFTSASIGIAYYTDTYTDAEQIIRDAETAMHRAKGTTDEGYKVFHAQMHTQAMQTLELETDMRHALERDEFALHFQPIIHLPSMRIAGFEALMRWRHPRRGMVPPLEFIPIAEETGIIVPLGEWALRQACDTLARLSAMLPENTGRVTMSVNLSARQFRNKRLADSVESSLSMSRVPAEALCLEVTESLVMEDPARTRAILRQMKELGVNIAIDDFGTGYSSLSSLHNYPFDTLKIDQAFVRAMREEHFTERTGRNSIVRTILALAESMGMSVVAEGIETAFQKDALHAMGCTHAQGYLFAKPMDADSIERLLLDSDDGVFDATAAVSLRKSAPAS